jgi:hypothetical protein
MTATRLERVASDVIPTCTLQFTQGGGAQLGAAAESSEIAEQCTKPLEGEPGGQTI